MTTREEVFALMRRVIDLGTKLPDMETIDLDDASEVADAKMIIAKMNKTHEQLMDMLKKKKHDD
jgi:hypothetical protein